MVSLPSRCLVIVVGNQMCFPRHQGREDGVAVHALPPEQPAARLATHVTSRVRVVRVLPVPNVIASLVVPEAHLLSLAPARSRRERALSTTRRTSLFSLVSGRATSSAKRASSSAP